MIEGTTQAYIQTKLMRGLKCRWRDTGGQGSADKTDVTQVCVSEHRDTGGKQHWEHR